MTTKTIELASAGVTGTRARSRGRAAAAIAIAVAGALLTLIGAGAVGLQLIAGDEDGYLTKRADLETDSHALSTGAIDLDSLAAIPDDLLGTVRIRMTPDGDRPLFVGIARAAEVDRYLSGVRYEEVRDITDGGGATYDLMPGSEKPARPARQDIWEAESSGVGEQSITWTPREGEWKVVAMNPNGSPGVIVHAEAGAKLGWLVWTGLGFLLAGIALLAVAIVVNRRRTTDGVQPPAAP